MNKILEHTHNGQRWLFVEVPKDAHSVVVYPEHTEMEEAGLLSFTANQTDERSKFYNSDLLYGIDLPSGNWQIVSKLSELTEEQAREIVETAKPTYFKDYCIATRFYSSPTQSLDSLIRSLGGDTNNEYLILKEG